jgi:hypothetical protein
MIETETLLENCPGCGAWPMARAISARIVQRRQPVRAVPRARLIRRVRQFLQERSGAVMPDDLGIREPRKCRRRPCSHAALPPGKWMLSSSWQRDLIFFDASGDDPEQAVRQRPL